MENERSEAVRFAPPQAEVADVAEAGQHTLAGRGTRLLAAIVDLVVQLSALWLVGKFTPWNAFVPQSLGTGFGGMVMALAVSFGVFVLLHGWLLAERGQTVGKSVTGIRILRSDGSRASFQRLIGLRYGIGVVVMMVPIVGGLYALVDALLIFRANQRCVHDLIADTIVVKA